MTTTAQAPLRTICLRPAAVAITKTITTITKG